MTKVETAHFTLQLPDGWEERANAEGVEWVTALGAQQLIASVVLPKSGADLRAALETLMTVRRTPFAKLAVAGELVPTGSRAEGDSWIGTMVGVDAAQRVLTFVRLVALPARIVTFSLFQYGTLDTQGFVARGEEIFSTLRVSREPVSSGWRRFVPWWPPSRR